jgi:hypothetical protein
MKTLLNADNEARAWDQMLRNEGFHIDERASNRIQYDFVGLWTGAKNLADIPKILLKPSSAMFYALGSRVKIYHYNVPFEMDGSWFISDLVVRSVSDIAIDNKKGVKLAIANLTNAMRGKISEEMKYRR